MHSQIIEEEVDIIRSMYATDIGDSIAKLNSECKERFKERYLAIAYLVRYYRRHFGQILKKWRTTTPWGTTNGSATLVNVQQPLITWKSDKCRISPGLSNICYTTLGYKKSEYDLRTKNGTI